MQTEILKLKSDFDSLLKNHEELKKLRSQILLLKNTEIERKNTEIERLKEFQGEQVEKNTLQLPDPEPQAEVLLTAQQTYQLFKDGFGHKILDKLIAPASTIPSESQKILKIANDPELWQQHLARISELFI